MKNKIILISAAVLLLVCALAVSVSAAECIDGIYYSFSDKGAAVSSDNQKKCELEAVVIPESVVFDGKEYTVTSIETKAFGSGNKGGGNIKIKSLFVPSTITSVGEYAFANCTALTEAYCKSAKVGSRMFLDCSSLEKITLENTVEIGGNAFNRTLLTSVVIPSTVTTVGSSSFKQCTSLTKVVVLGSIIGENMFDGCSALNTLVLTERFETFSTRALGVAPANGTFITYYTGTDYERVKALGSETSRFREAKCYSYEDYISGGYTDRYKLIYDTNLCVAAFGGIHKEPSDDGDCTTALLCSVCADYTYAEAMEHNNSERVTYSSFLEEGEHYVGCTNKGCTNGTSKKLEALFTSLGYSVYENGDGGIAIGFSINNEAVKIYEELTDTSVKYGVFAVSKDKLGDNDIFTKDGASLGVVSVEITRHQLAVFELKIVGFKDGQKDAKLAMGAYVAVTDGEALEYSYLQPGVPEENEKYCFTSYTEIVKSAK